MASAYPLLVSATPECSAAWRTIRQGRLLRIGKAAAEAVAARTPRATAAAGARARETRPKSATAPRRLTEPDAQSVEKRSVWLRLAHPTVRSSPPGSNRYVEESETLHPQGERDGSGPRGAWEVGSGNDGERVQVLPIPVRPARLPDCRLCRVRACVLFRISSALFFFLLAVFFVWRGDTPKVQGGLPLLSACKVSDDVRAGRGAPQPSSSSCLPMRRSPPPHRHLN